MAPEEVAHLPRLIVGLHRTAASRLIVAGATRNDAEEVNQRNTTNHRLPQADVVRLLDVGASIAIAQQAIGTDLIVIGSSLSLRRRRCRDAQWDVEDRGLENPLRRRQQRHRPALELEALEQHRSVERAVTGGLPLAFKSVEGGEPHALIEVDRRQARHRYGLSEAHRSIEIHPRSRIDSIHVDASVV